MAIRNTWIFVHEHRLHVGVQVQDANQFHLSFDGFTRMFTAFGPVAGDEERYVLWLGSSGKWMSLHDVAGPGKEDLGHAVVRANWFAVKPCAIRRWASGARGKAQFARNDFTGKVAFADKQRRDE